MAYMKKYRMISSVLFFLAGLGFTATALVVNPGWASAPKGASWTSLTYRASRLSAKLTVQVKVQSPAPMSDGLLTRMGAGLTGSAATARPMKLMVVDLSAEGLPLLDEQYSEKIWFDAADGRAYRRIRWRKGGESWVKIYSWTDQGVRRQKLQPADRYERSQAPLKWTGIRESFYPYPRNMIHSSPISDPTYLLYLLSNLEPRNLKSPFEMFVFGKGQLHRLIVRQEKSPPLTVPASIRSAVGGAGMNGTITPIVFSVTVESSAYKSREPEIFSLLGLERDIRITVDPATHLPIRVSGKNHLWGELVLDLSEVQRS